MLRRFVTLDGEIQAEEEWELNPTHRCFYCEHPLILTDNQPCPVGLAGYHDFVSLVH